MGTKKKSRSAETFWLWYVEVAARAMRRHGMTRLVCGGTRTCLYGLQRAFLEDRVGRMALERDGYDAEFYIGLPKLRLVISTNGY